MIMEQHANSDCDIHNEKCATHTTENLIFFCVEHTDTLCGRCVVSQHKSCNVVDLLEVNIDDEEVNVYRSTLQGLDEQLKSAENKIHRNVDTNRSCKERFLTELEHLRTEINAWFDRLQSRCNKQCSETFYTNEKCLTQVLTFCVGQRKDIEQRKELIEHLLTKNHIKRLYVALHRMRQDIEVIKGNVNWVDRENKFNGYDFKRSSGIQALLNENSYNIGGLEESCTGSDEICEDSEKASSISKTLQSASATRSAPKIKGSLFPETQLHLKDTKPKYSEHSAGTSDMKRFRPSYVSHQPKLDSDNDSNESDYGLRSLPADLSGATSYRTKFLEGDKKVQLCAICLDDVRDPKVLKCKHEFCRSCIENHFKSKPSCPTCGSIYGKIVGNQPIGGTMTMYTDHDQRIPGYEREDGMIVITYKFPDGMQDATHPHPGRSYKGIKRLCYLPNSTEGREVKRLLKKAFDARLLFTVGDSRTSGKTDVLTWNDVHHKTSIDGGPTKFGYPDPTYLKRVKEELAAKGITSA